MTILRVMLFWDMTPYQRVTSSWHFGTGVVVSSTRIFSFYKRGWPFSLCCKWQVKVKVIPQQPEVAQGVRGRLRSRIFVTFGTTRMVGRQLYVPAAFTPGKMPGTYFQRLSRPQGSWFRRGEPRKKSQVTPSRIDPGNSRLVAQGLNHKWQGLPEIRQSKEIKVRKKDSLPEKYYFVWVPQNFRCFYY